MDFPEKWFHDEVRDGFYVSGMVKRDWASQMEILQTLDEICTKHHLRWFLSFGGLLGAVRHHGFIPWDDDLDVCMPADDFERFAEAVRKELPEGYYVNDCCNRKSHGMISVFGYRYRDGSLEEDMDRFHDFPYSPSIDVFRLDYLSEDPMKENWRDDCVKKTYSAAAYFQGEDEDFPKPAGIDADTMTLAELSRIQSWNEWARRGLDFLATVEERTGHTFSPEKPLVDQIYALLKSLLLYFSASENGRMAFLPFFITGTSPVCYPVSWADQRVQIPFETTRVWVTKEYRTILEEIYGPDYMTPYKGGGAHTYPSFKRFEADMLSKSGMQDQNPYVYRFREEDLRERPNGNPSPKERVTEFLESLQGVHQDLHDAAADHGAWQRCFSLYHQCESTALEIGEILRDARGVEILHRIPVEAYEKAVAGCLTFSLRHQPLREEDLTPMGEALQSLQKALQTEFLSRMEVLFLPTTADRWPALESLWRACKKDPACNVTVMPLPYYEKDGLCGLKKDVHCERDQFPDEVETVSWKAYDIAAHHPDYIFIQSPYDQYNYVTTVVPRYYSTSLYAQTDHLVYIPWFQTCEFGPEEMDTVTMQFYAAMPGVVRADLTVVQSDNIRDRYIEQLTAFAGERTKPIWQDKIRGWGSPLQDKKGAVSALWGQIKAHGSAQLENKPEERKEGSRT